MEQAKRGGGWEGKGSGLTREAIIIFMMTCSTDVGEYEGR